MKLKNQNRAIIENVEPAIQNGKHAISRVVGEYVGVTADVFSDGHDIIQCEVLYKHKKQRRWRSERMQLVDNDQWSATFQVDEQGHYFYRVEAWVDYALNWQHGLQRKLQDGQYVFSELRDGVQYLKYLGKQMEKGVAKDLIQQAIEAFDDETRYDEALEIAKSDQLHKLFVEHPNKLFLAKSKDYPLYVDRVKARFSTWYEFFPRSSSSEKNTHGTFKDCEKLLPRVADMGFDVLYFPPIHPIGEVNRKGKNNTEKAKEGDVGSPWGIGSKHGGHKAIHPQLGSLKDFQSLIQKAKDLNIEIAMDFALQCAPDHPYVKSNPEWFRWRPDGTVQYAENPPKKYQDILPIYFESKDWKNLWDELLSIAIYWAEQGIRVFRVDNPHTKPFKFWGWLIEQVKKKYPDVLFLSEAFTKPKVMNQLAKQGFTQSYTYFTWRNSKHELQEYMTELTQTKQREYFRPNFWPNTPDINPWELQTHNQATFLFRHFLAATLSSNYGMYGPVYEFMECEAVPGKEEYLNSEKYEIRNWNWEIDTKISHLITKINKVRKEQPALQQTNNIHFCQTYNEQLIAFYKWDQQRQNHIICVANMDPHNHQRGQLQIPKDLIGIDWRTKITAKDLVLNNSYEWYDNNAYLELGPELPYHIFKITW